MLSSVVGRVPRPGASSGLEGCGSSPVRPHSLSRNDKRKACRHRRCYRIAQQILSTCSVSSLDKERCQLHDRVRWCAISRPAS